MSRESDLIGKLSAAIGEALLKVPGALNRQEWAGAFSRQAGQSRVCTGLALELFLALDSATFTSLAHHKLQFEERVMRAEDGEGSALKTA
jgi:hypothetical protein